MSIHDKRRTTALALMLLAWPMCATAQDEDLFALEGIEEEEPVDEQPVIADWFDIGAYWVDEDAYRYGKYTGLTDDGAELLMDFSIDRRVDWDSGDTRSWSLKGWRLGLDSRRIEYRIADQGKQSFAATWRQIPNNRIGDGRTPYRGAGDSLLSLPSTWEVAPGSSNTRGFTNLYESLVDLKVDTMRTRMEAKLSREIGRAWSLDIDYLHEMKEGTRTIGGIFGYTGGNPRGVILPAPVNFTTDNIDAMFNFEGNRVQAGIGTYLSFFNNDQTSLTWQNAYGRQADWAAGVEYPDAQGRLALEPDNSYLQLKGYLGFNLTPGSRLTADASFGRMEQNDTLLPYTVNPELLVHTPVPLVSLDGEIETTLVNLRYTTNLGRRLGLALNYRYDDRDNSTPRAPYPYIGADSQDQRDDEEARINLPYSYTNHESDATATLRLGGSARLKFGAEYSDYSREYSEVSDADEWTWLAGLHFNAWQTTGFNIDLRHSERDVDAYIGNVPLIWSHLPGVIGENEFENHPLMRKYFLTGRDRDEIRFRADFYPVSTINLGVSGSVFKDDYDAGYFGLNQTDAQTASLDFGWYPTERLSLVAYYTRESYDADQSSRSFNNVATALNPAGNWWASSEDDVDTWNLSLSWKEIGADRGWQGVSAGVDLTSSNVESQITVTNAAANTGPLPPLETDLSSASAWLGFGLGERTRLHFSLELSELDSTDFALDDVLPDTLANVLTLGESAANYDQMLLWASLTTKF